MTFIDTAEAYGEGRSEELVGHAIRGIRDKVFLATKFSPENSDYDGVIRAAERSLTRLGTDVLDLYQVHWPNPNVPIATTMVALEKLVRDGKVRYVGLSNFYLRDMRAAQASLPSLPIVSNQVEYNLFDRFIEQNVFLYCQAENITVIAYSPLDKGRMARGDEVLGEIASRYEKTPAQVVLNWLTSHKNVIAIPTTTTLSHVRDNASATDFRLTDDDLERIDKFCRGEVFEIDPAAINVSLHGEGNRKVYQTLEQALRNELNFCPSPSELAEDILGGDPIKPVRLVRASSSTRPYDLIEGRIRYWGWVIAFNGQRPIPALIRN